MEWPSVPESFSQLTCLMANTVRVQFSSIRKTGKRERRRAVQPRGLSDRRASPPCRVESHSERRRRNKEEHRHPGKDTADSNYTQEVLIPSKTANETKEKKKEQIVVSISLLQTFTFAPFQPQTAQLARQQRRPGSLALVVDDPQQERNNNNPPFKTKNQPSSIV